MNPLSIRLQNCIFKKWNGEAVLVVISQLPTPYPSGERWEKLTSLAEEQIPLPSSWSCPLRDLEEFH